MRTLDGPPARVRLPHEPLEGDRRPFPVLVAWRDNAEPEVYGPRLELAGPPEPVTYHVTYIHDPEHPSASGWFVVGSNRAHFGPLTDERAADQYRDYLENFPRTDPRD